jgi:hypothetical protein
MLVSKRRVALGLTARLLPHGKRPRPGRQPEGSVRLHGPRPDYAAAREHCGDECTSSNRALCRKLQRETAVGAIHFLVLPPAEHEWRNEKQKNIKGVAYAPLTRRCLLPPLQEPAT